MSTPTPPLGPQDDGRQPGQPPAHGAAPGPAGQQPPWGAPGPGNAPLTPGGYTTAARPPQVTTAAVLGFVAAAFLLLGALGLFALASVLAILGLFGALYLVLAAATIYGGVLAMQGRGSTVLSYAGLAIAGLSVVGIVLALTQGSFEVTSLVSVAIGAGIFFLLKQPPAQQWFASRGTR